MKAARMHGDEALNTTEPELRLLLFLSHRVSRSGFKDCRVPTFLSEGCGRIGVQRSLQDVPG